MKIYTALATKERTQDTLDTRTLVHSHGPNKNGNGPLERRIHTVEMIYIQQIVTIFSQNKKFVTNENSSIEPGDKRDYQDETKTSAGKTTGSCTHICNFSVGTPLVFCYQRQDDVAPSVSNYEVKVSKFSLLRILTTTNWIKIFVFAIRKSPEVGVKIQEKASYKNYFYFFHFTNEI